MLALSNSMKSVFLLNI